MKTIGTAVVLLLCHGWYMLHKFQFDKFFSGENQEKVTSAQNISGRVLTENGGTNRMER